MTTDQSAGITGRSVAWKLRSDLEISEDRDQAEVCYIIKDPLRLTYFRTSDVEWAFLQLCDGKLSTDEMLEQLRKSFPGYPLAASILQEILLTAIHAGIMAAVTSGYGVRLAEQRVYQKRQWPARFSILSVRWRGIDPTRLLRVLDSWFAWIYHPVALVSLTLLIGTVAFLVAVRADMLTQELPDIKSLFTLQNLIVLSLAAVVVKAIHELGHALTCQHYGGECHELGVLMVLFFPLLYCDVSDSWTMTSRWKRIAVSSAGIVAELGIAAVCGLLWMCSYPGALHSFFLNLMILCSANTVLVNGNPLLRYDGYYVLSDLLRIPNLSSESRIAAGGWMNRVLFGIDGIRSGYSPAGTAMLAMWGLTSAAYRTAISVTLLIVLYQMLQPLGLEALTLIPVLLLVSRIGMNSARSLITGVRTAPRRARAMGGAAAAVLILCVILLTPMSLPVKSTCLLTPGNAVPIFVRVPGSIQGHVESGQAIQSGQLVAELRNPELELQFVALQGEVRLKEVQVSNLETNRTREPSLAAAYSVAVQSLESARSRLQALELLLKDLKIHSPVAGRIYLPRNKPAVADQPDSPQLWSDWALSDSNQQAWMEPQTQICWVGDVEDWRVIAYVDQSDLELIQIGAPVTVRFLSRPGTSVEGELESLGTVPVDAIDRELLINQMVPMSAAEPGRPQQTLFPAVIRVSADSEFRKMPLYSAGTARISSKPVSLAGRAWRLLCHTFSFGL